jgi:hypothetical protein
LRQQLAVVDRLAVKALDLLERLGLPFAAFILIAERSIAGATARARWTK